MQDDAFTLLYQKYANFVYSIALSYLKNPAEAEDVTADVFVKLLESDLSFPEDTAARGVPGRTIFHRPSRPSAGNRLTDQLSLPSAEYLP